MSDLPAVPTSQKSTSNDSPASGTEQQPPPLPLADGLHPLPGEGQWRAGRRTAPGTPAIWTGYFRPDPHYPGMLAGVAVFPSGRTLAHLVAGTTQPGVEQRPATASVPTAAVPDLVATFNAGWRFQDAPAGFETGGHTHPKMINGLATAVITKTGQLDVRKWRTGANTDVAAARQNLHLIVSHGSAVPGLTDNYAGLWGSSHNQLQYTARTGIGVDRQGNVIFIAGTHMNLSALALAFQETHAQTAMELDIHPPMTFFAQWEPNGSGRNQPTKLLPTMQRPADRYLKPDQRDFFYVTLPDTTQS